MALVINDRVKETTTTTGTGAVSLGGAVTGFETFAAGIGNSNTTYYVIAHQTASEWEVGLGTLDGDSSDLTRTTVISSSNSDSAVSFAAGTKDVFCTMPASKLVFEDASSDVTLPNDLILGSDSAVLKFGADSDTTLTHTDGTGLTLNSTNKLLFRDSALYINSSTDGQLDIVADTEVQIAATTIDINGAVALNGAITGATNITLSGELDAATLDISGNADIDGTTNLDAVDIDGAVQLDATFTVGADDQGYDVKLFGDTASAYMLWDTSADDLILGGAAGLVVPDGQLTLGSTAVSSTAAEINLIDGGTSRGTTSVASGDGILINDGGTMRMTNVDTVSTYFASHNVGGGNIVTTGALDSGSITSGFGAIDNGTSGIRTDTFTAETSIVPDASDGATIGSASLEWSDLYLADEAVVYFGDDQEIKLSHVQDKGLTLKHTATADDKPVSLTLQTGETDIAANDVIGKLDFQAPDEAQGTDAILVAAGIEAVSEGDFSSSNNATKLSFKTAASEAAAEKMSLSSTGNLTVSGDLTISGDDLFMGTNTSGHILVADGTNYNPVAVSGDISLSNTGAAAIASGVIVNADVNASAAIADTKLGTIQTAGKVALSALEIDGASDIGEGIADADLFIVDNGAGGTNTKVAASRLKTYIGGGGAWNFISEANLSTGAAAGIDFTSGISSTYDVYMFHLLDIVSTNDANALQARVYTGSSALEDDSGDYRWVTWARSVSTTGDSNISVYRNHSANAMMLNNAVNNGNASGENTSGIFMIYNANSSGKSYMKMDGWMIDNDGTPTPFYSYGVFEGTAVITGMRFFSRDSNTESGTVRMYGLAKS